MPTIAFSGNQAAIQSRVLNSTVLQTSSHRLQSAASPRPPAAVSAANSHSGLLAARLQPAPFANRSINTMRRQRATETVQAGPARQAEKAGHAAKQSSKGLVKDLFAARERLLERGVSPGDIALKCGLVGMTLGFLFQITHNVGFLPVYDVWAFNLGPFPEAWTIPLLLAPIWLLYGYVAPIADEYVNDADVATAQERTSSLSFVLQCWAFLAAQFLLSDALYQAGQPHWVCHAVLSVLAAAIWKKFDGTKDGAVLAALLTVGAPVGEMLIVNFLGLWHYERPELFGVPTWAGWCYATYAIGVANVARYFVTRQEQR